MPKELPRPMSTALSRSSHSGIAGRHRQRINAIKRLVKIQKRASREQISPNTTVRPEVKPKEPPTRLSLRLFDSPFSIDNFLPCPSFVGCFSFASSFRRVSQGLKPFVRLPLRPDIDHGPAEESIARPRSDTVDTDSDIEFCDETTTSDLAPLSPLPWSPLRITPVDSCNQNKRSSTLVSSSSTGTHHVSMFDMYLSGRLVSQYTPLPIGKPSGVIKRRHTRRNRKSTLTQQAAPSRLRDGSSSTAQTFVTATELPNSQPMSETIRWYAVPVSEPSPYLAQTKARGSISQPPTAMSATELLKAVLDKYVLSASPPSPPSRRPCIA